MYTVGGQAAYDFVRASLVDGKTHQIADWIKYPPESAVSSDCIRSQQRISESCRPVHLSVAEHGVPLVQFIGILAPQASISKSY